MSSICYPIAPNGVFTTIQGEGALLGVPMNFVRLGGCSQTCPQCDTDYSIAERLTPIEIRQRIEATKKTGYIWITGGEPADYNLGPLLTELSQCGTIAVATSGHKPIRAPLDLIDFLSVSPHNPTRWVVKRGHQLNLVPGLNGLRLDDLPADLGEWQHRYVTPLYGSRVSLQECLTWLETRPDWRLGVQAHKQWDLP